LIEHDLRPEQKNRPVSRLAGKPTTGILVQKPEPSYLRLLPRERSNDRLSDSRRRFKIYSKGGFNDAPKICIQQPDCSGIYTAGLFTGRNGPAQRNHFTLSSFDGYDGYSSAGALIQATDGNFYGMTFYGSHDGDGKIYKTTRRRVDQLYDLDVYIGMNPVGALVQATNGSFTELRPLDGGGYARFFQFHLGRTFTTLHVFEESDGRRTCGANGAGTAMGNLYGITVLNGPNGDGTVFEMTPSGTLTTLYALTTVASHTVEGLMQGTDGNFYGIVQLGYCSMAVSIESASGTATLLYSFTNGTDGAGPQGPLCKPPMETSTAQRAPPGQRSWHGLRNEPDWHCAYAAQFRQHGRR